MQRVAPENSSRVFLDRTVGANTEANAATGSGSGSGSGTETETETDTGTGTGTGAGTGTDTVAKEDQKTNCQPNHATQASDPSERTKAMTARFRSSACRIQWKE